MDETTISRFWQAHPCGDQQVGGLHDRYGRDHEAFFRAYDAHRYRTEPHIPKCLDEIDFAGKSVLEIGLGQGAESEQIVRRGACWSGLDLTAESVARVRTRLRLRGLPFEDIKQGSALAIPYPASSFDIVFSHGVLHHVPEIHRAQAEIARVLRPGGELVVMVYAKRSLNYVLAIGLLRRMGLAALYALNVEPPGIFGMHVRNARELGLANYLKMDNFIHRNTDGPENPYSKVYDRAAVRADFPLFRIERSHKHLMHAPPLPVSRLPFGGALGWHLWVHMRLRERAEAAPHHPVRRQSAPPGAGAAGDMPRVAVPVHPDSRVLRASQ